MQNPVDNLDLAELAESSSSAFVILLPWFTAPPANSMPTALVSIVTQARRYVGAIDYSIVAAKNGFTIAQQAIVLAKILEEPGTQITDKECDEYLSGLVRLASEGQKNAMKAVNDFRDVRVTIEALIRDARNEPRLSGKADEDFRYSGTDLNRLEGSIDTLEKFSHSISEFIKWWTYMEMSGEAQTRSSKQLSGSRTALRRMVVVRKWQELQNEYMRYGAKISLLQDKYPEYKWLSAWKEPRNEEPEEKGILRPDIKRGMSLPRYPPRVDVGREQEIIQGEGPSELKNEYEHVGVDPGDVSLSRQSDRPHSDTEADLEDTTSSIQDGIVREETIQQDRETSEQDGELQLENTNLEEPRQGDEERLEEERAAILPLEEQLESRAEKQETKSKEEEGKIYSDRVQEKAVKKCPDCCCCVIM